MFLGHVLRDFGELIAALGYYTQALGLSQAQHDQAGVANSYQVMANVYGHVHQHGGGV